MSPADPLHLFQGYGIELEYMIVARDELSVRPLADEILKAASGEYAMEVERGDIAWSNELALHVIELKTNGPAEHLAGLDIPFAENIKRIDEILEPMHARLLPTAMHPWMDPHEELRLWPHENDVVYETFHRIFDCRGHGWANLQSAHINLPFADDREFAALHAAVRLALPLIPGLAASSPIIEGRLSKLLDTRLDIYRKNSKRIPSVTGAVVPERVFTRKDYEDTLLGRIYADLAPYDPDGVLRHEWVNARGCIARFDRMAIEIRIVDVQECPRADIAVAAAIVAAVRCLVEERWCSTKEQRRWNERELAGVLNDTIHDADLAIIDDRRLLASFGYPERGRARLRDVWQHLIETLMSREPDYEHFAEPLELIVERGCLARRITAATGPDPTLDVLHSVYRRLADCLASAACFTE